MKTLLRRKETLFASAVSGFVTIKTQPDALQRFNKLLTTFAGPYINVFLNVGFSSPRNQAFWQQSRFAMTCRQKH